MSITNQSVFLNTKVLPFYSSNVLTTFLIMNFNEYFFQILKVFIKEKILLKQKGDKIFNTLFITTENLHHQEVFLKNLTALTFLSLHKIQKVLVIIQIDFKYHRLPNVKYIKQINVVPICTTCIYLQNDTMKLYDMPLQ